MSTAVRSTQLHPSPPDPGAALGAMTVVSWPDPLIDALGHDPRSAYVERFWLGILGPSTTWLLRRLAEGLESQPDGFLLDLADTAAALGLGGKGGRHSPFMRALGRCCRFDLAEPRDGDVLAVRRRVPPLTLRQLQRLPASVVADHERWQASCAIGTGDEELRRRCRRLALSLVEMAEDREGTERQLLRWRFPPLLAQECAEWAIAHHRRDLAPPT